MGKYYPIMDNYNTVSTILTAKQRSIVITSCMTPEQRRKALDQKIDVENSMNRIRAAKK